jgi:hypothetical protein
LIPPLGKGSHFPPGFFFCGGTVNGLKILRHLLALVVSAILCKRRSSGYGPVVGASSFFLVTLCPDSWNYSAGEDRRQGRAQRVHREP